MSLEITGKLVQLLEEQKGESARGPWLKQEFLIETEEKFPKQICLAAWNERASALKSFQPGERLKIAFDIESREFRGKWYTNLKAWSVDRDTAGAAPAGAPTQAPAAQGLPQAPPYSLEDIPPESDSDVLPF